MAEKTKKRKRKEYLSDCKCPGCGFSIRFACKCREGDFSRRVSRFEDLRRSVLEKHRSILEKRRRFSGWGIVCNVYQLSRSRFLFLFFFSFSDDNLPFSLRERFLRLQDRFLRWNKVASTRYSGFLLISTHALAQRECVPRWQQLIVIV